MSKLWINEHEFIDLAEGERPLSLSAEIATRQRTIDFYGLGMYLPNPDPVLKKMGKDIEVYEGLLSDDHLGGCVTSRAAGVLSLEWGIDRGKAKSRQAKLIEDLFGRLKLRAIIEEMLDAPLFGYKPMEVIWERVGGYVLPTAVVGKPQRWFCFDEENQLRFRTKEEAINGELLPDRKFLLPRYKATYENPYGFAILSRCFWPVTFKRGGLKFWVKFSEKWGMPFGVGKQPRGTGQTETAKFLSMLEAMIQDAVAVIPDDSSVEILEAAGKSASADIYKKLIDECKTGMSIAVLGQNLTTEVKGGSYAATKSHMAVRKDIVDSDKVIVEETLNQLIEWVYEVNFGPRSKVQGPRSERTSSADSSARTRDFGLGTLPTFSMWEEEDVDKTLAERDKVLTGTGVKFTKTYYIKAYGLEETDFEVSEKSADSSTRDRTDRTDRTDKEDETAFAETTRRPLASSDGLYPDQDAIDAAIAGLKPAEIQKQAEGVLRPIIELIEGGHDYQEILDTLAETYPKMDDAALQEMLTRAVFVSEVWGRLSAGEE